MDCGAAVRRSGHRGAQARSKSTPCGATLSRDSRSWLNQVEIWFAKIQRDLIDRGIFISTTDLRRKIMSYIRLHNRNCRPFRWTYRNTKQRIRVDEKPVTAYSRAGTGAVRPVPPSGAGRRHAKRRSGTSVRHHTPAIHHATERG
jgi:hypothetical protein